MPSSFSCLDTLLNSKLRKDLWKQLASFDKDEDGDAAPFSSFCTTIMFVLGTGDVLFILYVNACQKQIGCLLVKHLRRE